jgi:hypothetical protein
MSLSLSSSQAKFLLAQRLRKFSATFSSRAPPLELRMLLPDLEADFWILHDFTWIMP